MASLHKQNGRSCWYCAYTTKDGQRHFKSTGVTNKKAAQDICRTWGQAALHGEALTLEKAREIITRGVETVLLSTGQTLPGATIREWCNRWLATKELENESTTHERYEQSISLFLSFLGSKANRRLETLTPADVLHFRDRCAKTLSVSTTNTHLKIMRACFNSARMQLGVFTISPASRVSTIKDTEDPKRRAMTADELRKILKTCGTTPWRGLVLMGLYTGQRLGDVARVTWQQIDLAKKTIWFVTTKTGKRLCMAIAAPLFEYLSGLPSTDDPSAYVFPEFSAIAEKRVGTLSNAFAEKVLIPAQLMLPRPKAHKRRGKGRGAKRATNPITFHSLRHSFTTMLKATGASNALAQLIVGHDSSTVSAHYTHLGADDTTDAIGKLPDVTKPEKPKGLG